MNKFLQGFCFLIILVLASPMVQAQEAELIKIEYTFFPQANSDNSFRRFKSVLNFPIKLNGKGAYIIPGVEYKNVNLIFKDPSLFNSNELDRFESYDFNLGYTFKMKNDWRFGSRLGIKVASNFTTGEFITDDIIYTGGVFFIKTINKEDFYEPARLILGLHYTTTSGMPIPFPVVNYYKRWNSNWSFAVGAPKSNLKYHITEKSKLQAFATLDGFFGNIQDNFKIEPNNTASDVAENISMTILLAGLGYEYNFTNNFSFYIYGGHTLINDIRLRDANRDKVYTINNSNSFYGRGGLKFSVL